MIGGYPPASSVPQTLAAHPIGRQPAVRVRDIMHREVVTVGEDQTCADAAKLL